MKFLSCVRNPVTSKGLPGGTCTPEPQKPFSPSRAPSPWPGAPDRKSTRLNSSHRCISYAVFCLKKRKDPTQYSLGLQMLFLFHRLGKSRHPAPAESAHRRQILQAPYHLFFFNDTATTEIYTLSLHDALPI